MPVKNTTVARKYTVEIKTDQKWDFKIHMFIQWTEERKRSTLNPHVYTLLGLCLNHLKSKRPPIYICEHLHSTPFPLITAFHEAAPPPFTFRGPVCHSLSLGFYTIIDFQCAPSASLWPTHPRCRTSPCINASPFISPALYHHIPYRHLCLYVSLSWCDFRLMPMWIAAQIPLWIMRLSFGRKF